MPPRINPPRPAHTPEVVSPRWILTGIGVVIVLALVCGYLTLCGLFYNGQWQLAVTPTRTVTQTPTTPYKEVHFGTDISGQPQLFGWFIPVVNATGWTDITGDGVPLGRRTALLLHSGKGSISDALPTASLLHDAGLNVLVFDYRGFGRSGGQHPTQHFMQEDAAAALQELHTSLGAPSSDIVIVGDGIGAALAVHLCENQPDLLHLILLNAEGDIDRNLSADPRAAAVPAHLLFHENFPLAIPLQTLKTPKLLITSTTGSAPASFRTASDPKTTVEVPPTAPRQVTLNAITRFLSDN